MEMTFSKFIFNVLNTASDIAIQSFGKVSSITKINDNNQVLTQTDIKIGNFLIKNIQDTFPTHNIIDEEAGVIDNGANYTWVIDPIDGTSNFAEGVHTYGIMIGLLLDGMPVAGGISLPSFHEIYIAEKNTGTLCNGKPIHVTQQTSLSSVLVAYGIDGHPESPERTREEMSDLSRIILNIRNLRSSNSCYDCAMVAKGCYGASLNQTSKIWDCGVPRNMYHC